MSAMSAVSALRYVAAAELDALCTPGALVVVVFMATWNRRCQAFAPDCLDLASRWSARLPVVCVDVDESPALSARFEVCSVPTVLVLRAGEVLHQEAGLSLVATEACLHRAC